MIFSGGFDVGVGELMSKMSETGVTERIAFMKELSFRSMIEPL